VALGVGQGHEDHPAHAGLQVLGRDAREFHLLLERVHHRGDRLAAEVQAGAMGQVRGVVQAVLGREHARHRDAVDVLGAEGVDGDGRYERGVDAAGEAEHHGAEAVLDHVVAQPRHHRRVHLRSVLQVGRDGRCAHRLRRPARAGEVHEEEVVLEGGRRRDQGPARVDDERRAVEHQVVLGPHQVDVGERGVDLARAGLGQEAAQRRLPALVGRAVDHHEQVDAGLGERLHRASVLPDVLADHHADPVALDLGHEGARAG